MSDRTPPASIEAEQSVLGAILIDPDAIVQVADTLVSADFYRRSHQVIYRAMVDLYEAQKPTDIMLVADQLEQSGNLDLAGGRAYLSSLSNETPTSVHVIPYSEIVRRDAVLRNLITAATKIAGIAYAAPDNAGEAIDAAESALYEVSSGKTHSKYRKLTDLLHEAYDKLDYLNQNKGQVTGVGTGLKDLDSMTQGFQKSDLIILAARPSVGKTSLSLNIAEHAAISEGNKVGVFSLEMSQEQLVMRLLSAVSGVDSQRLRTGFMEDGDFSRISAAMNALSKGEIYIDDTPVLSIIELRTKARRMQAEVGLDLIVVDYLQLMTAPGSSGKDSNRVQEVSVISRGLKAIARELDIPVLALSQLRRPDSGRESLEPRLSDLRESGSIEQDADLVLLLWRKPPEEGENPDVTGGDWVNLKLAKNRNGPTGEVDLWFKRSQTKFFSMEDRFAR